MVAFRYGVSLYWKRAVAVLESLYFGRNPFHLFIHTGLKTRQNRSLKWACKNYVSFQCFFVNKDCTKLTNFCKLKAKISIITLTSLPSVKVTTLWDFSTNFCECCPSQTFTVVIVVANSSNMKLLPYPVGITTKTSPTSGRQLLLAARLLDRLQHLLQSIVFKNIWVPVSNCDRQLITGLCHDYRAFYSWSIKMLPSSANALN